MPVDIQVIATHVDTKQNWDIGTICEQIDISWSLYGSAGSMDISCIPDNNVILSEGDVVSVKVDGVNFFYGIIFKVDKSAFESIKYKLYDIKRYLSSKDVDIIGKETIDQAFSRICTMANMPHKIINTSSYIIPTKVHDGESYDTMLQYAIDQTFIATGQRFCIRANGTTLELLQCNQQLTDVIFGDQNLMTDYKFSSDIEDTYTAFRIQREIPSEQQKKMRPADIIIKRKEEVGETDKLSKYGRLHYYEKVDAKYTDAQLSQHLQNVMQVKSRKQKSLQVEGIGNVQCIPGNMIPILISDLESDLELDGMAQKGYCLITEAKHTLSHNEHVMSLDLEIG